MKNREVIVVGAGPAGLVAAIAARRRGLDATVLDSRVPPIDKPCGEGILPQGIAALKAIGISLPPQIAFPFRGIRFVDERCSASADFAGATGFSVRRTKLHEFLIDNAIDAGVEIRWGERVVKIDEAVVTGAQETYSYKWLAGADGQNSYVRKCAGLDSRAAGRKRFGFCSHFRVKPWSEFTEVHWSEGCQIFVTPMRDDDVGIAVLSRDPRMRLENALRQFPALAQKLRGASRTTREAGDTTKLRIFPSVATGRVALIGDASGTVDALTGHGLSLSFQQAVPLAEAMSRGDLSFYREAHKQISSVPILMARLMLLMGGSDWIRRRTIRLFQATPGLFARMLAIHTEAEPLSSIGMAEIAGFGWKFLTT